MLEKLLCWTIKSYVIISSLSFLVLRKFYLMTINTSIKTSKMGEIKYCSIDLRAWESSISFVSLLALFCIVELAEMETAHIHNYFCACIK